MSKKISMVAGFVGLLLLSIAATSNAGPSNTSSTGAGPMLGMVEGAIKFCSKVSPGSMSSYTAIDQLFTSGQSNQTLAQVRNSDAYESAVKQVTAQLKAVPASQAAAECNAH